MSQMRVVQKLDEFTAQYIDTALWSTLANRTDDDDSCLNAHVDRDDLSSVALAQVIRECREFQEVNEEDIDGRYSDAGHDFWLTREGHGCGFWDGDWPEPEASRLTTASEQAGEQPWYIGDDGLVHIY